MKWKNSEGTEGRCFVHFPPVTWLLSVAFSQQRFQVPKPPFVTNFLTLTSLKAILHNFSFCSLFNISVRAFALEKGAENSNHGGAECAPKRTTRRCSNKTRAHNCCPNKTRYTVSQYLCHPQEIKITATVYICNAIFPSDA